MGRAGRSELMISEHNTDHISRSQRRSLPIVAILGWLVLIAVSMSASTRLPSYRVQQNGKELSRPDIVRAEAQRRSHGAA
jgi:hypothetical protein